MPQSSSKPGKIDMQKTMSKQMLYFMPILTVFIAWNFPAGLPLYWIVITVLGLAQEYYLLKKVKVHAGNQKNN